MIIHRIYNINPDFVQREARKLSKQANAKVLQWLGYDAESAQFFTEWEINNAL